MTERPTRRSAGSRGSGRARRPADEAPRRAGRPRAVAEIVPEIGRAAFRRFGFVQSSIVSRWPEIVGPRYAGVSGPESIRFPRGRAEEGVLTLVVEGAHAATIQHVAPELVDRVNRFFGYTAVARIQIRHAAARARPAPRAMSAPPATRPAAEIGDSLRGIGDPELRAVLESLAAGLSFTGVPRLSG